MAGEEYSAKSFNRPAREVDAGEADPLLSMRLDPVSRSVADFAGLLARNAAGGGSSLLSPTLDTEDAAGEFLAHVLAAAVEYERDLIGARTREGMMHARAEGVHIGRPRTVPAAVLDRIAADRAAGLSLAKIADTLTAEGIATAHGAARLVPVDGAGGAGLSRDRLDLRGIRAVEDGPVGRRHFVLEPRGAGFPFAACP